MSLFQEIPVWKSIDNHSAVRYVCFLSFTSGKYCVQSADFFQLPIEPHLLQQFDRQIIELFIEVAPSERCDWFDSLSEAIEMHEKDFG